ncbi:unnamed protein product [Cuscuta campestris]|uniref:DUF7769 domain-containing protein n=1 Tax=Cuscuta campestris TaxID=132261 RepID=A0A484MR90_9ASTE|nr:unnamed protein product [Cuscuta campestris]
MPPPVADSPASLSHPYAFIVSPVPSFNPSCHENLQSEHQEITKRLSNAQRQRIVELILLYSRKNISGQHTAQKGIISKVAADFNVSRRTVGAIWSRARKQLLEGVAIDVKSRLPVNSGRKRVSIDIETIGNTPLAQRTTIKRGLLRSHSNAIKPFLTDENMLNRLQFCFNQLEPTSIPCNPRFKTFHNVLHMDEKWFFMSKTSQKYYLTNDEMDPYRTCKSKRFITKVMFLCVVGRPFISENGEILWDGKIGIFPFVETVAAKRKSKNREAGVLEVKQLLSVTKEVTKDMLVNQVIPAIREKWPSFLDRNIILQQDNAKPHISATDPEFMAAASGNGFNIILTNQPPNSPDLNILDLGFFRAIQSLKEKTAPKNVAELVEAVKGAYATLTPQTLNKVWLSYQHVMQEVMNNDGGNKYKLPHMAKDRLAREGTLPVTLNVPHTLLEKTVRVLSNRSVQNEEQVLH